MEIRIGIQNLPREVAFESSEEASVVARTVSEALSSGAPSLTLVDDKGRVYVVPTSAIGYVEIGTEETRRIGFGA